MSRISANAAALTPHDPQRSSHKAKCSYYVRVIAMQTGKMRKKHGEMLLQRRHLSARCFITLILNTAIAHSFQHTSYAFRHARALFCHPLPQCCHLHGKLATADPDYRLNGNLPNQSLRLCPHIRAGPAYRELLSLSPMWRRLI